MKLNYRFWDLIPTSDGPYYGERAVRLTIKDKPVFYRSTVAYGPVVENMEICYFRKGWTIFKTIRWTIEGEGESRLATYISFVEARAKGKTFTHEEELITVPDWEILMARNLDL